MKIAKHNSHGMQLLVELSLDDALHIISKLSKTVGLVAKTDLNHYITLPCQFEDDNDIWEPTDLTLVVGDFAKSEVTGRCQSAYPCGKPVEARGSFPAGPCILQEGHKYGCLQF